MRLAIIEAAVLVAAMAVSGCCKQTEEQKAEAKQRTTEYMASLRAVQATLATNALPPPGNCPKLEEKGEGYGGWDGFANTATPALFAMLDGKGPSKEELETWGWMHSKWLEETILEQSGGKSAGYQSGSHITMLAKSPYIVIFKATRKAMPKPVGEEGFDAGVFEGDLIVFERKSGKALCRAPFAAESSEEVSHKTRGIAAKSAEDALNQDFREQFSKAATAALKKIAPTLKISVY